MAARVVVAALALAVAACGDDPASGSAPAEGMEADLTVDMREMAYEPEAILVPSGTAVTVRLHNAGALRHDLTLPDGTQSDTLNADETAIVEIGPLAESVTAWCSVPGHRNAGMELEIAVEE